MWKLGEREKKLRKFNLGKKTVDEEDTGRKEKSRGGNRAKRSEEQISRDHR